MTTYRVAKRRQYSTLDTRSLSDSRLSFRARGVLAFLLSKPDNWEFSAESIAGFGQEGRDAIRAALRELVAVGYLVRLTVRGDHGHLATETVLYEHPDDAPKEAVDRERVSSVRSDLGKGLKAQLPPDAGLPPVGQPASGKPGPLVISSSLHEEETESQDGHSAASPEVSTAEIARELTREAWKRRERPPGMSFIGVAKVVEGFLDAGRTPAELEWALVRAPAFTANCLEFTLNQKSKPKRGAQQTEAEIAAAWGTG